MFKIGQFAQLSQVSVKTLRYYESLDILLPCRIDKFTGYRYYSASKIHQLNKILAFKVMGFSLNEIAELLKNNITDREVNTVLITKKVELKTELKNTAAKLNLIENLIEQFHREANIMYDVSIKEIESFKVASYRATRKSASDQGEMWQKLAAHIEKHGAKVLNGCFASYHCFSNDSVDIEVFDPIDKDIPSTADIITKDLPKVTVASVIHKGPYTTVKNAFAHLSEWIEKNSYEIVDVGREIYIAGDWNCDSPADYVTEIQVPVQNN